MGKKIGTCSLLTIVKGAFRSPTKDNEKKSGRQRDDFLQEEEEKKREKRRWAIRKPHYEEVCKAKTEKSAAKKISSGVPSLADKQRRAIAVAAATAAAAEAAVATAKVAVEIARLNAPPGYNIKELYAAVVIQTAFRGYLARRALLALKGIVKLQAIVRGRIVRKQTQLTLNYMQALVRAQDRGLDQFARFSLEHTRNSMFAETTSLWDSANLYQIKHRKSLSRNFSGCLDDWGECPRTSEGNESTILNKRKEAALKREKALAYAFSSQIWRSRRNPLAGDGRDLEEKTKWFDRWMATKQWYTNTNRASTDKRVNIKTVEMDISRPYSYSVPTNQKSHSQNLYPHQSPTATPSPCKPISIKVRSASPRCMKEERNSYSAAQTPCLNSTSPIPNYMAATESAKARAQSQSTPRQRPSTPHRERSGSVKKRLSYPAAPSQLQCNGLGQNLRSSSFKSAYAGIEQLSNYSSCYTESFGGEISPSFSGSRFSINLWE